MEGPESVYLHDIPLEAALDRLASALQEANLGGRLGAETLPLDENVLGRVLAEPVFARLSSPHYHASAMDGFAVRSAETAGAQLTAPLTLSCDLAVKLPGRLPGYRRSPAPLGRCRHPHRKRRAFRRLRGGLDRPPPPGSDPHPRRGSPLELRAPDG